MAGSYVEQSQQTCDIVGINVALSGIAVQYIVRQNISRISSTQSDHESDYMSDITCTIDVEGQTLLTLYTALAA